MIIDDHCTTLMQFTKPFNSYTIACTYRVKEKEIDEVESHNMIRKIMMSRNLIPKI